MILQNKVGVLTYHIKHSLLLNIYVYYYFIITEIIVFSKH